METSATAMGAGGRAGQATTARRPRLHRGPGLEPRRAPPPGQRAPLRLLCPACTRLSRHCSASSIILSHCCHYVQSAAFLLQEGRTQARSLPRRGAPCRERQWCRRSRREASGRVGRPGLQREFLLRGSRALRTQSAASEENPRGKRLEQVEEQSEWQGKSSSSSFPSSPFTSLPFPCSFSLAVLLVEPFPLSCPGEGARAGVARRCSSALALPADPNLKYYSLRSFK